MKISLNLPYVMSFDDYHEISDFVDRFNEMTNGKLDLKFTEIMGESDYGYQALLYAGKQDKKYRATLKAYKKSIKEEK